MSILLQINSVVNISSTGRISEELGQKAIALGWNSYIAYGRNKRDSKSQLIKIGTHLDVVLHGLQTRLFDRHGLGSRRATLKLVDQIDKINPDIIHLNIIHGYYLNIEVLFKYLSKINTPIIWTFYDCWSMTGHCSYFDSVGCEKWKTSCFKCPQKNKYPSSILVDRSRKNYILKKELFTSLKDLTIISNSNWLASIINNSFFKDNAIEIINSGVDIGVFMPHVNHFTRLKYNIKDKFVILGVAYLWEPRKGLLDFIQLSKKINSNCLIILLGLDSKQIKNLPDNIIGVSRTEFTQELAELYSTADVFLNPTWEDNFPTTNLESLACGTPVITYKTGGSIESISQDTGFIVEKGDIEGLLNAIETVRLKGKASYSAACRARAVNNFNNDDKYKEYVDLYEKVVKAKSVKEETYPNPDLILNNSAFKGTNEKNPNKNYQICTHCVMDTTDPNIRFDNQGVCDHCHDFKKYVEPNWHTGEQGKHELTEIVAKIKASGKGNDFDCLLGMSGGVDSSYMLHLAVKVFGLRPLVFHVDGGWNSELAVHNINVMVDKLGLDLYTEVINWEEMKDFQLAFFKSGVPHLDIPQDHAFVATLYKFADKYKIKYILNGGNFSTECVQYPMQWFYYGTDLSQINDIRKKFGTNKMESYPFSSVLWHKFYLRYFKGIKVVKPLNYMRYFKAEAVVLLEKEYGWKPYPQKHFESRFTKFYEGYWLTERFGYDTRKVQLSSLILTGQMTREEALEEMKKPAHNPATIEDEFNYIATKLGIEPEELRRYLTMPKKYYWDYKNQQNIFRLGAKALHLLGIEKVKKRRK